MDILRETPRLKESWIWLAKSGRTSTIKLCSKKVLNVAYSINICGTAQKEYKRPHDKVTCHFHWCLCRKCGSEADQKPYGYNPEKFIENHQVKVLWDFNIQTAFLRAPYLIAPLLINNQGNDSSLRLLIRVTIISRPQNNTVKKSADPRIEVARMHLLSSPQLSFGRCGSTSSNIKAYIEKTGMNPSIPSLQKSLLPGTANILRKMFSM